MFDSNMGVRLYNKKQVYFTFLFIFEILLMQLVVKPKRNTIPKQKKFKSVDKTKIFGNIVEKVFSRIRFYKKIETPKIQTIHFYETLN